ncbi:MAG TPA: protein translocase subunit SecF [Candidatus Paceibacterota bacterium]|nr:protein translocase subunit SecF [Candidatus Paceibacterota bacterium]
MFVIIYRKIFYTISIVLITLSITSVAVWGINFGIDFTGGSILEINFVEDRIEKSELTEKLNSLALGREFSIRETGETGYILKSRTIDNDEKELILSTISENRDLIQEIRFNNVGPTLGDELRGKALISMLVVILAIVLFIAIAFSQVSKPISSWKYGLVAIITFLHDVIVPIGLFSVLGRFYGVEVDTLFVIAILVVLGYSINDTIIIFDRIRENLKDLPEKIRKEKFEEVVGKSLRQTFSRAISTSITTIIMLLALFVYGGESTKWFSLALIAGIAVGTYSSIFFAAPMLVTIGKISKNK